MPADNACVLIIEVKNEVELAVSVHIFNMTAPMNFSSAIRPEPHTHRVDLGRIKSIT